MQSELDKKQVRLLQVLFAMLNGILAVSILIACSAGDQTGSSTTLQAPTEVAAITTQAVPSKTPNYKEVAEAQLTATNAALRTQIALSPVPSRTPGPPPEYPTPTLAMGWVHGCVPKNTREPQCLNGWRGIVNGETLKVIGGMEGSSGDPTQGLVMVYIEDRPLEIYNTPQKAGPVRIVDVSGTLVTLAAVGLSTPGVVQTPWATQTLGTVFTFDLSTRQWVSPSGTPIPSTSPSPSP
jgi:hypothetical protein